MAMAAVYCSPERAVVSAMGEYQQKLQHGKSHGNGGGILLS